MDIENSGAMGGPKDAANGRAGEGEDRGGHGVDLEIFYRDLGRRDRVLLVVFLILVAWPDHWIRLAFIILLGALELRTGDRELEWREYKVKPWERRVVCGFALFMAMSKLVWWSLFCAGAIWALREFIKKHEDKLVLPTTTSSWIPIPQSSASESSTTL